MNVGLKYYENIFKKNFGGIIRTKISYKSIKMTAWLLMQAFLAERD